MKTWQLIYADPCSNDCCGEGPDGCKHRLIEQLAELLSALKEAELDCRGEDALHGWLENAVSVISKVEGNING